MRIVLHKPKECIGCDSCTEIAGTYFMLDEDGCAKLISQILWNDPFNAAEVFTEDVELVREAGRACPVQIINFKDE